MIAATATKIARRSTADGKHVCLWSDGSLTWALGASIKGAWFSPKPERRDVALRAGWLVLGEVEIYDESEVSALCGAARWSAERDGMPGTMRARMHAHRRTLVPAWSAIATDRDGKVTQRSWVLPQISKLAGTAVFDHGHGPQRYSIWFLICGSKDSYTPSGIAFATQAQLLDHLESQLKSST